MYEAHKQEKPSDPESGGIGLLLGVIGLTAGTAWYLKHSLGNNSRPEPELEPVLVPVPERRSSTDSHSHTWLLGALGAGLMGALVGASTPKTGKIGTRGSSDVTLASQVTINRSPQEIYQYWRNFQNLPQIMSFIERIDPLEGNISHWVAKGPAGPTIEWDAEVVDDDPGKLLAWRSIEGSDLQTWGSVIFSPREGDRGTEVSVTFNFSPPGTITGTLAKFMSGLENSILDKNLRNLKSQLEAGEIATSRRYGTGKQATSKQAASKQATGATGPGHLS